MKYIFIENGIINGAGGVQQLDEGVSNIEISDEIYETYINDPLKYTYQNGQIIENPEYETLKQQQLNEKRIQQIQQQLNELDQKRIRAICEDEVKNPATGETWLDFYNAQIYELRTELNSLNN